MGLPGFPGGTSGKELACHAEDVRDAGSTTGSGRSPGRGHGNPLQYSCLENSTSRGAWQATVHRVAKSRTWLMGLSACTHTHTHTKWGFHLKAPFLGQFPPKTLGLTFIYTLLFFLKEDLSSCKSLRSYIVWLCPWIWAVNYILSFPWSIF